MSGMSVVRGVMVTCSFCGKVPSLPRLPPSLAIAGSDPGLVLGGRLQAGQVLLPEVGVRGILLRGGSHLMGGP